jgi:hypothetical protein
VDGYLLRAGRGVVGLGTTGLDQAEVDWCISSAHGLRATQQQTKDMITHCSNPAAPPSAPPR